MKKNVLYLIIIVSAVLMLAGWTNVGQFLDTHEPQAVVSVAIPRSKAPDYFADGKLFTDVYLQNAPAGVRQVVPDNQLDAEFFNAWYQDASMVHHNARVPDYPLDGKLFSDMYSGKVEVVHCRPILILAGKVCNLNPVDETMSTTLLYKGLGLVGFILFVVIAVQYFLDRLNADFYFVFIV